MLDFAHLPKPENGTIDYFPGFSTSTGGQWEVWNKPKNCIFIRILCIRGGGGGSSGFPSATTNARGGGAGGSSGQMSYVTIPAVLLPDKLYVSAGVGGRGGESSTTVSNPGATGIGSFVSVAQSPTSFYLVCGTGTSANNGAIATSSVGGAAQGGGSGVTLAVFTQAFQGHFSTLASAGGGNGGAATGATGFSINYPATGLLLSGGSGGGGGAGFSGGSIFSPTGQVSVFELFKTMTGGEAGTVDSPTGGNGSSGVQLYQPLLATGGCGGGSSFDATARGGDGGNGGIGCGGGGGGAGGTDGGGAGGNGGPGLVVIHAW